MHICRFDTVSDLRGKNRTYENIKAAVLAAGRFSCFDVETKRDGELFTKLCNDPEIEVIKMQYPWTGIRRLTQRAPDRNNSGEKTDSVTTSG